MSAYNSAKEADAVRHHHLNQCKHFIAPDQWMEFEADTLGMQNVQLAGVFELLRNGEHVFNAVNLMQRVPSQHVKECVRRILPQVSAQQRRY